MTAVESLVKLSAKRLPFNHQPTPCPDSQQLGPGDVIWGALSRSHHGRSLQLHPAYCFTCPAYAFELGGGFGGLSVGRCSSVAMRACCLPTNAKTALQVERGSGQLRRPLLLRAEHDDTLSGDPSRAHKPLQERELSRLHKRFHIQTSTGHGSGFTAGEQKSHASISHAKAVLG